MKPFLAFLSLPFLLVFVCPAAQSPMSGLQAEHDPVKRSDLALRVADDAFDAARDHYGKGEIDSGNADLERMTSALNECVSSLQAAHKSRFYKKAELRVAYLQRRMSGLLDNVDVEHRGWVEYTDRKLEEIHVKLLNGVMNK